MLRGAIRSTYDGRLGDRGVAVDDLSIRFQDLVFAAGLGPYLQPFAFRYTVCVGLLCYRDELGSVVFRLLDAADLLRDSGDRLEMIAVVENARKIRFEHNRVHLY